MMGLHVAIACLVCWGGFLFSPGRVVVGLRRAYGVSPTLETCYCSQSVSDGIR